MFCPQCGAALDMQFNFNDESPGNLVGVPMVVEGTDLDGNAVNERVLGTAEGASVSLLRGTYKVRVAGNPVTKEGAVYSQPEATVPVTVDENGAAFETDQTSGAGESAVGESAAGESAAGESAADESGTDANAEDQDASPAESGSPEETVDETQAVEAAGEHTAAGDESGSGAAAGVFEFEKIPALDITDEQIASIKEWLLSYGISAEETNETIEAVTADRQEARDQKAEEERKQAEEEERKRKEAEEARKKAAMAEALDANPSVIKGTSEQNLSQRAELTGVVHYELKSMGEGFEEGYVCYLKLPRDVTILGSQYGEMTGDAIILLDDTFPEYEGKTITVSGQYVIRITASIPSAAVSPIIAANGTRLVQVWD